MSGGFVFAHRWRVPAARDRVFAALAEVERYPQWWPQVLEVQRLSDERGRARIRSALPYSLDLVMTRTVQDLDTGTLRVDIEGDLIGFSQFLLSDGPEGTTVADYSQEVTLGPPGLRRIAPLAGPVLRWNHTVMMRAGERGLAAYLTDSGRSG